YVPDSLFKSPILLIHPVEWISGTAHENPSWLKVTIGTRPPVVLENYRGESVWIGSRSKLSIPQDLVQKWKSATQNQEYLQRLLSPKSLPSSTVLEAGESIDIQLFHCDPRGTGCSRPPYASVQSEVATEPDFPQEVYLDGAA